MQTLPTPFRLSIVLAVCAMLCPPILAAEPVSATAVRASMEKAKAFLYSKRGADGWESASPILGKAFPQGINALTLYALMSAGENSTDERLKPIIDKVLTYRMSHVYEVAVRSLLYEHLKSDKRITEQRRRDLAALLVSAGNSGPTAGMFAYGIRTGVPTGIKADYFHISTSNYGVLGVWAGAESGLDVPNRFWEQTNASWRAAQKADGSWSYQFLPNAPDWQLRSSMSMTTAGLASLLIAGDFQANSKSLQEDKNMSAALEWIDKNFDVIFTQQAGLERVENAVLYCLYNLERVGTASGLRYIGNREWYERGAAWLLAAQRPDGSWAPENTRAPVIDTAFGLLFLAHGSAAVAFTKLDPVAGATAGASVATGPGTPRDVYNLSRWMSREVETRIGWQRLSLDAPPDALADARVTYINPASRVDVDDAAQVAKLKSYIDGGGLILASGPKEDTAFSASIRKLGTKLVPGNEFRNLPETHPIFTRQQYPWKSWKVKPEVLSLSNGVRECVVHVPGGDLGRAWQQMSTAQRPEAFQLAADVFLYSVSQDTRLRRGETRPEVLKPNITKTGDLRVARIQYNGNWNPEPLAWDRLGVKVRNASGLEIATAPVELAPGKLDGFKVAHLTGTTKLFFTGAQRDVLKQFTETGGLLVIDSAGGSSEFDVSARSELEKMFPADAKQLDTPLPVDHPLYGSGDAKLKSVTYRQYTDGQRIPNEGPRLRGITIGDKLRVLYSAEDLTAGWADLRHDGIQGYTPDSAAALGRAILRFTTTSGR